MTSYSVYINGQKAIDAAQKIIENRCYKNMGELGQFEIVLDSDQVYNGYIQKWVSVYGIKTLSVIKEKVFDFLNNHGFSGCLVQIFEESIPENSCCINQKLLEELTL